MTAHELLALAHRLGIIVTPDRHDPTSAGYVAVQSGEGEPEGLREFEEAFPALALEVRMLLDESPGHLFDSLESGSLLTDREILGLFPEDE